MDFRSDSGDLTLSVKAGLTLAYNDIGLKWNELER